jgi:hypothetical protein
VCRCDERLKVKAERYTRLAYTGSGGELEHLKIETSLIDEGLRWCTHIHTDPLHIFETTHGERGETWITWRSDNRWRESSGGKKERKWYVAVIEGFSSSTDASVWYDADRDVCFCLKHAQIRFSRRDPPLDF